MYRSKLGRDKRISGWMLAPHRLLCASPCASFAVLVRHDGLDFIQSLGFSNIDQVFKISGTHNRYSCGNAKLCLQQGNGLKVFWEKGVQFSKPKLGLWKTFQPPFHQQPA